MLFKALVISDFPLCFDTKGAGERKWKEHPKKDRWSNPEWMGNLHLILSAKLKKPANHRWEDFARQS